MKPLGNEGDVRRVTVTPNCQSLVMKVISYHTAGRMPFQRRLDGLLCEGTDRPNGPSVATVSGGLQLEMTNTPVRHTQKQCPPTPSGLP